MKCSVHSFLQIHENGKKLPEGKRVWLWVDVAGWKEVTIVRDGWVYLTLYNGSSGVGADIIRQQVTLDTEFTISATRPTSEL